MLPPGRNKVPGQIKQGGGPDSPEGLMFATCVSGDRSSGRGSVSQSQRHWEGTLRTFVAVAKTKLF